MAYFPICLRTCYALPGTDMLYDATSATTQPPPTPLLPPHCRSYCPLSSYTYPVREFLGFRVYWVLTLAVLPPGVCTGVCAGYYYHVGTAVPWPQYQHELRRLQPAKRVCKYPGGAPKPGYDDAKRSR